LRISGTTVSPGQQIFAVIAGKEIVLLAEDDLQAVPFQLHVADDLGIEQADGIARRAVPESRMEFVGHRRAADLVGRFEDRDLETLLGEVMGASQAVMPSADNQNVVQCRKSLELF
jgi:hypothetical protein